MNKYLAPKLKINLEDYDFELDSVSVNKGGKTKCGEVGRKHRMKRSGPMVTKCIYPGCDAVC